MMLSISARERTPISAMKTIRVRGTPGRERSARRQRRAPAGELKHRQPPGLLHRLEQPLCPRELRRQPSRSPAATGAATPAVPMSSSASRTGRSPAVAASPRAASATRSTSAGNSSAAGHFAMQRIDHHRRRTLRPDDIAQLRATRRVHQVHLAQRHHVGRPQLRPQQRVVQRLRICRRVHHAQHRFQRRLLPDQRDPSGCARYRRDRRPRWFRSR